MNKLIPEPKLFQASFPTKAFMIPRNQNPVFAGCHKLRNAATVCTHHRFAACHSLGNDEAKRLGLRARMDYDVEPAHRGGRVLDKAGENNPVTNPELLCNRAKLVE